MEHPRVCARCWTFIAYLRERFLVSSLFSGVISSPATVLEACRVANGRGYMQLLWDFMIISGDVLLQGVFNLLHPGWELDE